jgi:hypothetical protein
MSAIFWVIRATPLMRGWAAGDQAGILGWGWLLISLLIIFVVAILLIMSARLSDKSPYLANLAHGGGHDDGHAAVESHAASLQEAVAEPPTTDDLIIIEGIGPKINQILNQAGISTFAQLADTGVERLSEILLAAGLRVNDPATWPEQAALAAQGKWQDLEALQTSLKGGRRA